MSDVYETKIIERNGREYRVQWCFDTDTAEPWREHDGHGPVMSEMREWKNPGEVIIHKGRHERTTFYDFAEATRIAKRDGWGLSNKDEADLAQRLGRAPTRKQIVREAVMRDMNFLRGWCNDEWHWCGIVVTGPDGEDAGLWSIESNSEDYHAEVIEELIDQIERGITADEDNFASSPC